MEVICSSETSAHVQATQYYIPEDGNIQYYFSCISHENYTLIKSLSRGILSQSQAENHVVKSIFVNSMLYCHFAFNFNHISTKIMLRFKFYQMPFLSHQEIT
jgi:hypothetical protein